jgi:hypothetical protein
MARGLDPIVHLYHLRCAAEPAFEAYTTGIGRWWDPQYTADPATLETVTIEPRVGGRVYASHADLGEHDWGEVTVWEPGRRIEHTFHLAQDPSHPTTVSARFAPTGTPGCTFRFSHGGWSDANAAARPRFADWPGILARFVALADQR